MKQGVVNLGDCMAPIRKKCDPAQGEPQELAECRVGTRVLLHGLQGEVAGLNGQRAILILLPSLDSGPEARCLVETDSGERAKVIWRSCNPVVRSVLESYTAADGSSACCASLLR